jgi:cyclophilin family peptidyl-prolyl cis-trans isomerase
MKIRTLVVLAILAFVSCTNKYKDSNRYVKIITDEGDIIVRLYNETPKHTENFIKLTEQKFFDDLIFHRVIKDFVVQGGDPETRNAEPGKLYGEKDAGYLVDPEIIDTIYHKRGVIAIAREGDDVNPEKKSSSSQFYLVVGKLYTNDELNNLEVKLNKKLREKIEKNLYDSLLSNLNNPDSKFLNQITQKVSILADSIMNIKRIKFNDKQRSIYTTLGGIPHLDGNYTVFGEIVEGYDVVEKISQVQTDSNDRPVKDIKFKVRIVK